ncbi:MAG: hypothetical protein AAFY08_15725 [Planctomycetota bacterium]
MVLSASVFIGGAGAVLYTGWGSTWGAWVSLTLGAGTAIAGILGQTWWADAVYPWLLAQPPWTLGPTEMVLGVITEAILGIDFRLTPDGFPFDGQWWSLLTMLIAIAGYVLGSLAERAVIGREPTPPQTFFKESPPEKALISPPRAGRGAACCPPRSARASIRRSGWPRWCGPAGSGWSSLSARSPPWFGMSRTPGEVSTGAGTSAPPSPSRSSSPAGSASARRGMGWPS